MKKFAYVRGVMMKRKVMIVGAGVGGTAILRLIHRSNVAEVIAVVDINVNAEGIQLAKDIGVATYVHWSNAPQADIVFDATGNRYVYEELVQRYGEETFVVSGAMSDIIVRLLTEKNELIRRLEEQTHQRDLIFNSAHDGMIVVDPKGKILLFNHSAEKMIGYNKADVIGKYILEIVPKSQLPRVLETKQIEVHQEVELENGKRIISTRIPIIGERGELQGAFSVFTDITEIVNLAEEVTDLKEVHTLLQAIIQSSEEAISVVDEQGRGLLINPAYTRMTGLSQEEVIGKPATADIAEGESMHMRVLKTRRPVRGIQMKVGPKKRDVVVNVAPVIVDGVLKGSVGVIRDVSEIQKLTNELSRARQIIRTLEAKYSFEDIIGVSEGITSAIEQAKMGADTPATVLLRGESGTGKELFAHAIHNESSRKYNKFIRVNCASISESLLESELFGYEEGAFSGAKRGGKRGFFEEANNGSIFLDEIGELSAGTQAKLLRVLQEKEIVRVGGTKAIPINVRVIAATNVNLEKAIAEGRFREDLYYRLNKIPIYIPPLRERKEDIESIATRLIQKINQDYGRNVEGLTGDAIRVLQNHEWPGNVRELENILGRAIIFMASGDLYIDVLHLPTLGKSSPVPRVHVGSVSEGSLEDMVVQFEGERIVECLERCGGNKTQTAKMLGISVRNLYYKLEKYNRAKNSMQ
ncbi:sigma 54-interacting transcriptional regulator [Ectobacillus antri]|jgi:PAS domain S-box-containing protein